MNRIPLVFAVSAAAALAFAVPHDAHALGPVDVEVGLTMGGGATTTKQLNGVPNPLGLGLGGRAGVGLFGLYVGVEGMDYRGNSAGTPNNVVQADSDLYGVDVGYSLKLPLVTIRPLVGIGNFTERVNLPAFFGAGASGSASPSCGGQSYDTLYIQPGITGIIPLGMLYVGADANVLLLTSLPREPSVCGPIGGNEVDVALTFHAQVGVRF
jgi:hypothetical protein